MEYEYFKIPKPDLSIFLDVPPSFTQQQLTKERDGDDRDYLNGAKDIHEEDLNFQQQVRMIYMNQVAIREKFKMVNCANSSNEMGTPDEIFSKVMPFIESLITE